MISSEVAERRGMRYDRSRISYLMDLDVEGRDNRYWYVAPLFLVFCSVSMSDYFLFRPQHRRDDPRQHKSLLQPLLPAKPCHLLRECERSQL